jgi:partner of Y14 and mago protein
MNPEQLEKLAKLEGWRQELKLLEGKKAEEASS